MLVCWKQKWIAICNLGEIVRLSFVDYCFGVGESQEYCYERSIVQSIRIECPEVMLSQKDTGV